jgi:dTDP-4-dehydrorhamnose reductase
LKEKLKIWITGSSGQLGGALVTLFKERGGWEVICPRRDELDLSHQEATRHFIQQERPNVVVHAAAYTAVEEAEDDENGAMLMNGEATRWISEECSKINAMLIYISTDYVFDGEKGHPYVEDDPVHPINVYGRSKRMGELAVLAGENAWVIRASWIYSTVGKNFFKTMIQLAQTRSELRVVDDQLGAPTYAKSFAEDLMEMIIQKYPSSISQKAQLLHYSPMGETSWYHFAKVFLGDLYPSVELKPVDSSSFPQKARRPKYSKMSNENWVKATGIVPASWESQLSNCIADWKKI